MVEDRIRLHFDSYLGKAEVVVYSVLALLLAVTALVTLATAGEILWSSLSHWTAAAQTLRVLNELLVVLMLVEILHTVPISIRSHILVTEPFLVVGLIASIRRILAISLEMTTLSKEATWSNEGASIFRASMFVRRAGLCLGIFNCTSAPVPFDNERTQKRYMSSECRFRLHCLPCLLLDSLVVQWTSALPLLLADAFLFQY